MIPTLVSVIRGTNVFSMALESKGFGYSNTRSNFLKIKMSGTDYLMLIIGLVIVAAASYLKFDPAAYNSLITLFPWGDFA